jgi:hypothetical protein
VWESFLFLPCFFLGWLWGSITGHLKPADIHTNHKSRYRFRPWNKLRKCVGKNIIWRQQITWRDVIWEPCLGTKYYAGFTRFNEVLLQVFCSLSTDNLL